MPATPQGAGGHTSRGKPPSHPLILQVTSVTKPQEKLRTKGRDTEYCPPSSAGELCGRSRFKWALFPFGKQVAESSAYSSTSRGRSPALPHPHSLQVTSSAGRGGRVATARRAPPSIRPAFVPRRLRPSQFPPALAPSPCLENEPGMGRGLRRCSTPTRGRSALGRRWEFVT